MDKNKKERQPNQKPKQEVEFRASLTQARDLQYYRYVDDDPTDTTPARLTGIYSENEMNKINQANEAKMDAEKEESLLMKKASDLKEKIQASQRQTYSFSETNNTDDFLNRGGFNLETFVVVVNGQAENRLFLTK